MQILNSIISIILWHTPVLGNIFRDKLQAPPKFMRSFLIVEMDPNQINEMVLFDHRRKYGRRFFVDGEWDKEAIMLDYNRTKQKFSTEFTEDSAFSVLHYCLMQYHGNMDFTTSEVFMAFAAWLQEGNSNTMNGYIIHDLQTLTVYVNKYISIYNDIKLNGYKLSLASCTGIAVGRDGYVLKHEDGRHRLLIAKVLEIPKLPVLIKWVHLSWYKKHCSSLWIPPIMVVSQIVAKFK